jgi:putative membrane protein
MTARFAKTLLCAVALGWACAGWSVSAIGATGSNVIALKSHDREFVTRAAEASWAEIAMGQLAQSSGRTDAVRQFGQRMVKDHTATMEGLESITRKLGITSAKEADPKHQGDLNVLAKATGAEFDRLYAGYMVTEHERTVQLFQRQAKRGENAELRQFAARQLPILQEHLSMARSLTAQRQ